MGRPPCCDKSNVKKGLWTAEEDKKILAYVSTHGAGNWASVPKKAGLKRCGKSCRLRWTNYLRPDLKHDDFTPEEEQMIITLHAEIGSRWSFIAQQLLGRTDNDVKNYWNTKLKKKLIQRGIDPVTHRPISHVVNTMQGLSRGCTTTASSSIGICSKNGSITRCHKQKDPRVSCLSGAMRNVFTSSMQQPAPASPRLDAATDIAETKTPMQQTMAYDCNPASDLLVQLHAVKLVADDSKERVTTPASHFTHTEAPSASYSSISLPPHQQEAVAAAAAEAAPPDSSWTDFIFHGAFPPLPEGEPQVASHAGTSSNLLPHEVWAENGTATKGELAEVGGSERCSSDAPERSVMAGFSSHVTGVDMMHAVEAAPGAQSSESCSAIDSFVESLLSRDDEMMWEFPEFLDDPFGCP